MKWMLMRSVAVAVCLSAMPLSAQDKTWDKAAKKEHRAQMAEMHKKMLADMKQENADLQKAISEMNSATGEKKVDAIAAAVSKLGALYDSHVKRAETMHEKMAERWKAHHQQGGASAPVQ